MVSLLNIISSEIHQNFRPLFDRAAGAAVHALPRCPGAALYLSGTALGDKDFLTGDIFTIADAYLFTVLNWAGSVRVDLSEFNHVQDYLTRVGMRPAVQQALRAEGLLK